jgi:hypothetical protein
MSQYVALIQIAIFGKLFVGIDQTAAHFPNYRSATVRQHIGAVMSQQQIIYALVTRGSVVLSECSSLYFCQILESVLLMS